jgi:hypothetical protein
LNDQVKPFETIGSDGKVYLHYDRWERWRNDRLSCDYPPLGNGKARHDIELSYPSTTLAEVPIDRNPHDTGLRIHPHTARTCFYSSNDWLTIFDVHEVLTPHGSSIRTVVENGTDKPVGERIRLMSTSSFLEEAPWSTNPSNYFAYFRGKYWRVTTFIPLQAWELRKFPHSNLAAPHVLHPLAMPPELLRTEGDQLSQPPSLMGVKNTIPDDLEGHYARWESTSVLGLGIVLHSVWEYTNPIVGTTRFITVAPATEPLPDAFVNMPDDEEGILVPIERKDRKYLCKRIATGTDRNKGVNFLLKQVFGEPLP